MDKLFTLSAELTLEAAGFLQALRQAEQSARAALQTLQGTFSGMAASVCGSWNAITASIQAAILKSREFAALSGSGAPPSASGQASGLAYLPDDLARLDQGGSVPAKADSARWRTGTSDRAAQGIDYARLGQAVAAAMAGLSVQLDGQTVGMLVTPTVSREMGRQARARQYTV